MRKFTWAEYYDSFYEWSPGTQKNYSYGLENYSSAEEVLKIASEFAFDDEKFAARFVDKAMNAGVRFTAKQVMEMVLYIEKPVLSRAAELACTAFTAEDMENLYVLIDDASFERISKKLNIDIFVEDTEDADDTDEIYDEEEECCEYVPPKKQGVPLSAMFATLLGTASAGGTNKKRHNGECNGDCANCPPHYGYRYGRWYYGHGHVRGCQFGGNKGDGSLLW